MTDTVVNDPDRLDRIVTEILGPVDFYDEGRSPEGPWFYRTLSVRRHMNRIIVYDVDGTAADVLAVPDLSDHPDPNGALRDKLDDINERTLAAL